MSAGCLPVSSLLGLPYLPPGIELWRWCCLLSPLQALAALSGMLEDAGGGAGLAPAAATLLPALCKCLDSGNPPLRQASF